MKLATYIALTSAALAESQTVYETDSPVWKDEHVCNDSGYNNLA